MNVITALLVVGVAAVAYGKNEVKFYAQCQMKPNTVDSGFLDRPTGNIDIRQPRSGGGLLEIRINITGMNTKDDVRRHGFHIHEWGDLSDGCESAGSHYNPLGVDHGGPYDFPTNRQFGDLGNVEEDDNGNIMTEKWDYLNALNNEYSVLGRTIVIHEKEDDEGKSGVDDSLTTGNAGARLGCCVIGSASEDDGSARWNSKRFVIPTFGKMEPPNTLEVTYN